jgi:hypothetical protein
MNRASASLARKETPAPPSSTALVTTLVRGHAPLSRAGIEQMSSANLAWLLGRVPLALRAVAADEAAAERFSRPELSSRAVRRKSSHDAARCPTSAAAASSNVACS